ncbi:MAG TPA: hypothetical protein VFO21_10945 [Vicinamibacterales bacterium]|nr:hypothetical protein [Vicinamibacterales bacterium]
MKAASNGRQARIVVSCTALLGVLCPTAAFAFDYAEWRAKAVKACEAIDRSESQGGLIFNPDGYRSFYVRSKCFQEAAVTYRDPALCAQVRQRWSLFGSSWGYSAARCRVLVAEGLAKDRSELEALKAEYAAGGIKLRDFRVERNGNGRDIDIIPSFTGTFAHGYTLTFEILPEAAGAATLLHTNGYHIDATSNLNLYVRQADVRQRLAGFALNRAYRVRATVTLGVGFGGQSGYRSPAFIEGVFPTRDRSHSIVRQVTF